MIKKVIGFNEILNKKVDFIKKFKGNNYYAIHRKTNSYDNIFVELDDNFIINICSIEEIENSNQDIIENIPQTILKEYHDRLNNNRLV